MPQDFRAYKKFGQHFLQDPGVVERIIHASHITPTDHILEVGGGPGILTKALLASHPQHLTVIELDRQFWPHLEALGQGHTFTLIQGDALRISLASIGSHPLKIIANLPYNIGTQLIINWLGEKSHVTALIVMLQKEVVERICAAPGQKSYGRLSILVQSHAQVKKLFDVPPSAFYPPPAVDSSILELRPLPHHYNSRALEALTHIVFQQRRKMLRVTLKPLHIPDMEAHLEALDISPTSRPEELSVATFMKLAERLKPYLPLKATAQNIHRPYNPPEDLPQEFGE